MGMPTAPYGYPGQAAKPAPFFAKGAMPMIWALLIGVGLLLVAVGAFIGYGGESGQFTCEENAATSPCSSSTDTNNANEISDYFLLQGIGFLLFAIGALFVGLMWSAKVKSEEAQAAPAAAAAWSAPAAVAPQAAPAPAAPAWTPPAAAPTPAWTPPAAAPAAAPAYQPAPAATQAAPAAAAASAVPNCKGCGRPTTYVAQYSRYYCNSCAQYV